MKIMITMEIDPEYADSRHAMGVTEEGYEAIYEALCYLGTDIDVVKA